VTFGGEVHGGVNELAWGDLTGKWGLTGGGGFR
jgi:hypothetical protein